MKQTILLHDAQSNCSKGMNKFLIEGINAMSNTEVLFSKFHGKLFGTYQKYKFSSLVWHVSEYTQELHDFIRDYDNSVKIYLVVDGSLDSEFISHINKTNINVVLKNNIENNYAKVVCTFDNLYDDTIFFDANLVRNNKIVVLLSKNNQKNTELLSDIIYPKTNRPIVLMNNPEYQSEVNIGVFNYPDLADILNTYSGVVDLDQNYVLESQATGIDHYDTVNNSIVDAIDNSRLTEKITNIENKTYKYFIEKYLIPHIMGDR